MRIIKLVLGKCGKRVKCLCNCARWMLHCAGSGEAAYLLLMLILLLRFFVRLQFPFCVFNVCTTRTLLCLYIVLSVCIVVPLSLGTGPFAANNNNNNNNNNNKKTLYV